MLLGQGATSETFERYVRRRRRFRWRCHKDRTLWPLTRGDPEKVLRREENSLLPVKDTSKGLLLTLAGMIIGHAIAQSGQRLNTLAPAAYLCLCGANEDVVAAKLKKSDIPINASTESLLELLRILETEDCVKQINNSPQTETYWTLINDAHWPSEWQITEGNAVILMQHLIEHELLLSRIFEQDHLMQGLDVAGVAQFMKNHISACESLFVWDSKMAITAEQFMSCIDKSSCHTGFAEKQSQECLKKFVQEKQPPKLKELLHFATGYSEVSPLGLPHKISLQYHKEDDENAIYPTAMACLAIVHLPTVHSQFSEFSSSRETALACESKGFANV